MSDFNLLHQYNGDTTDTQDCFPLVHFYLHLFLYDSKKRPLFNMISNYHGSNYLSSHASNGVIEMEYTFQNQSSPSTTQITIHGLTSEHVKKFQKGCIVSIWAGWEDSDRLYNNIRHIFESSISSISPLQDSSGDWVMSFTCQDGHKFSGETPLSKEFKSKSKSVRKNASATGEINQQEKAALKDLNKNFGIKAHNIREGKDGIKKERAKYEKQKRGIASSNPMPTGKGSTSKKPAVIANRKAARQRLQNKINELAEDDAKLTEQNKSNTAIKRRKAKHIRTVAASKKKKARAKATKKKTKAKKQSSNGYHFKKNTKASTIIKKLAQLGHIHIARIDLKGHDKVYHSGYTATGTPFKEIQNVVNDCNMSIWWPHGDLVIGNFANESPLPFTLTPDTGLIQTPEDEDDGDSDSDSDSDTSTKKSKKQQKHDEEANPKQYDVDSVFLPFLTTGVEFRITDPPADLIGFEHDNPSNAFSDDPITKGSLFDHEIVVLSGELDVSAGAMPESQFVVEDASAYKKSLQVKASDKAKKAREKKAAKDKKARKAAKAKRAKRQGKRRAAKKPKKPSVSPKKTAKAKK